MNRDQGFSVRFPGDWELREGELGLAVIGLSPLEGPSDEFRENLSVASSEMTKPLDADGIMDANIPSMMKMVTDFNPSERGYADVGGKRAAKLEYTQRQGQFRLSVTLYALAGGDRAYLIHCTSETSAMSRFNDKFDKIVSSFKVLE